MEYWKGKTAVVTGAGMGIGERIACDLALHGMTVIGIDFTDDKIEGINQASKSEELNNKGKLVAIKCDVRKEEEVIAAFDLVDIHYGGVDVLINNAAVAYTGFVSEMETSILKDVIETNLLAVVYCSRQAIASLRKRGTLGHIIMMNSISGHYIPNFKIPGPNLYTVSKHGLTNLTEVLRREFRYLKINIKVTNFSSGVVNTSLLRKNNALTVDDFWSTMPLLTVNDISQSIINILNTPPHLQVNEILLRPLHEEI